MKKTLTVDLPGREYQIEIQRGLLDQAVDSGFQGKFHLLDLFLLKHVLGNELDILGIVSIPVIKSLHIKD